MDTAKLQLAAQRYREAEAALDAARADLRAEAVAALQQDPKRGDQSEVVRITGWTREQIRTIMKTAGGLADEMATPAP
ncbi:hypothetical protein ACFYPN_13910 [Streptomyces sp. NPDC005576]|uniref:hypothetical protein n=1 Tax=Streptomyces sp. NPDC005576 TaxID=3364726 RepID=UPI003678A340